MANKQPPKAKIELFPSAPIKFWCPVTIPLADGRVLELSFLFKHRTRTELAKLGEERIDRARERFEAQKAKEEAEKASKPDSDAPAFPETPKFAEQVREDMANTVEGILEIAEDWNVDGHEFNAENLTQLCNLHGAAAETINVAYRDALSKGRLGN